MGSCAIIFLDIIFKCFTLERLRMINSFRCTNNKKVIGSTYN